ncbi:hypothetical protein J6590_105618 [Homalodisca vitripennis]|nr:hypothetical protein J6590_105618 [Homalodisca vitripennis]
MALCLIVHFNGNGITLGLFLSLGSSKTEEPFAKGHTLRSPAGTSEELQGGKQPQTWTDSEEGDKRIKHPVLKRPCYTGRTEPMDRSEIDRRPSYSYHPRSPSCSPPPQSSVDSWWTEEPFAKGHTLRSPAGASEELQGGKQPQTWTDSEEGDKRIKHPVFKRPYYTDRPHLRSPAGASEELQGGKQPQTWIDFEEGDKRIKHPVFKRPCYTDPI